MKKKHKGQLVFQYVEKISRKLLDKYPKVIRDFVKGRHGIYALYKGNKLYYVGLASNLRSRLGHHLRDRHRYTWDRFSLYLTLSDKHLHELESLVLRISSPKGNIQAGKFAKAKNLRRTISGKIRELQNRERLDFLGEDMIPSRTKRKVKIDQDLGTLAPYVSRRFHIRLQYRDKWYIAHVLKTGWITFDNRSANFRKFKGKRFKSPSGACKAIIGRSCDGWHHWRYRNEKGEWVLLDNLRKKG